MATLTAADRRTRDKHEYNAMLATCPTRQLLDILSDKWVCLVFCVLMEGPARHSEIARRISGVSQKMLTKTVRQMERDGLITRTVHPVIPPRVEYELTGLGRSLGEAFCGVWIWVEAHWEEIARAREVFEGSRQPG